MRFGLTCTKPSQVPFASSSAFASGEFSHNRATRPATKMLFIDCPPRVKLTPPRPGSHAAAHAGTPRRRALLIAVVSPTAVLVIAIEGAHVLSPRLAGAHAYAGGAGDIAGTGCPVTRTQALVLARRGPDILHAVAVLA